MKEGDSIETFRRKGPQNKHPMRQATAMLVEQLLPRTEQHNSLKESDLESPSHRARAETCGEPMASTGTSGSFQGGLRRMMTWKPFKQYWSGRRLPDLCDGGEFRIMDRLGPFGQSRGHWAMSSATVARKKKRPFHQKARSRARSFATSVLGVTSRDVSLESEDLGFIRTVSPRSRAETAMTHSPEDLEEGTGAREDQDGTGQDLDALFMEDIYHAFLDAKGWKQLLLFGLTYVICFIFFALLYLLIDKPCGLGLEGTFLRAYLLSVESMLTIGYGVPDPYMKGCWQGAVVLTMQSLTQLIIGACLIGVIFQGLSRPQSRACTIVFSDRAVINSIDGAHYFMFRLCDLRIQHALIEPHVRCYCVKNHPLRGWEMIPMRLEQPDDELGASLLLTLPCTVVHRIDRWSPLSPAPPGAREVDGADRRGWGKSDGLQPICSKSWPKPRMRQSGAEAGGYDTCLCPTCGESFQTVNMLKRHCFFNARSDEVSGMPEDIRHKELTDADLAILGDHDPTREELEEYFNQEDEDGQQANHLEVVVLVEGIEPTTSSTLQARHSYTVGPTESGDFEWEADFEECCEAVPGRGSKGLVLDLSRFHTLRSRELHADTDDMYNLEEGEEEEDDDTARSRRRGRRLPTRRFVRDRRKSSDACEHPADGDGEQQAMRVGSFGGGSFSLGGFLRNTSLSEP